VDAQKSDARNRSDHSKPVEKAYPKTYTQWIVFLFMGITEVTVWINGEMHQTIANLNDNLIKIIQLFGPDCEKYYGWER